MIGQAQANPYGDKITEILQRRAQQAAPTVSPEQYNTMGIASIASGAGPEAFLQAIQGANQQKQEQFRYEQESELQGASTLYDMFEQKRAAGDKQAQALFDRMNMFTGGDPTGNQLFLEQLNADPEDIDPSNAYQVMTKLAGIAKKTGYVSPTQKMTDLDIEAKKLGLLATKANINASNALAQSRLNPKTSSADLPSALQIANEYRDARAKGDTQRMQDIVMFTKSLEKGQTVAPTGEVQNVPGFTKAAQETKVAEGFGSSFGKAQGEATFDLPRVRNVSNQAIAALDETINSPGLKNITGWMSTIPITPGGERARADALLDQVGGRVFLAAYDTLKGGGQITEIEGIKAEKAIAAIGRAQSYEDVVKGLNDLRDAIVTNAQTKEQQAKMTPDQMREGIYAPPATGTVSLDDFLNEQ
jgi:hypothetical protein